MWKKTEETPAAPPATARPTPTAQTPRAVATIGPSITVAGDLTGEEDLLIEGRLEGEISLKKNNVTVGKSGRVKADIYGRTIRVDGEVRGNLYGEQEVVIRASGRVQGNLIAPRVTLENGSKFKGSIDMEPARKAEPEAPKSPPAAARPAAAASPDRSPGKGSGKDVGKGSAPTSGGRDVKTGLETTASRG